MQITAKEPLPHVTPDDSDKMGVGQWAVAIGHPRGLDQTVTQGIIITKHRPDISDPSSYQDFFQTDAAVTSVGHRSKLLARHTLKLKWEREGTWVQSPLKGGGPGNLPAP